ncbi:MAG: hypothetical protein O2857_26480 [Planctomycetota bacterium]|nr:hypothetical protein [Planctomycetota bacterium]
MESSNSTGTSGISVARGPMRPSFIRLPKVSPSCIDLWIRVLNEVPSSRLILKAQPFADERTVELFYHKFEKSGLDRSRIDLFGPTTPLSAFLAEYSKIDIALDTLPYNGGTTTCQALWMGVPVITMPGKHFFSRMGLSVLSSVGAVEWIAKDAEEYVRLATELASDVEKLNETRSRMRKRVAASSLCNEESFTKDFETKMKGLIDLRPLSP